MISEKMNKMLNDQVQIEFSAAYKYLAMYTTFDNMGLKILAARFHEQYLEELEHAGKFINYMQDIDGQVELQAIDRPKSEFSSVEDIVQTALEGEMFVTKSINNIMTLANEEKDHQTANFLQWFIEEQVEEEASMRDLLDLVKLAGKDILLVENRVRNDMANRAGK